MKVRHEGNRLIVEWDNRATPKSGYKTVGIGCFWIVFAGLVGLLCAGMVWKARLDFFTIVWSGFMSVGLTIIALLWITRYVVERIEIDKRSYRHTFVGYPWLMPRTFAIEAIDGFTISRTGSDSNTYLMCIAGNKYDMIAYWGTLAFQRHVLHTLQEHVGALDISLDFHDSTSQD